jgi:tetratricopeptide (TPR) repeat protein
MPLPNLAGLVAKRVLGQGGYGLVVLATAPDGEEVAVKVPSDGQSAVLRILEREAAAMTAIGAPPAPRVVRFEPSANPPFLAMEYLPTPTLSDQLADAAGPLSPAAVSALSFGVIDALRAVHRAGWAWLDLKPENLIVEPSGRVRLLDFGASLHTSEPWAQRVIRGTAEYMSPEQAEGQRPSHVSDVYSFGVALYEWVTGRVPFWGPNQEVQKAHVSRRPPLPSTLVPLSAELEDVILKCLEKVPHERFQTVEALRSGLEGAFASKQLTRVAEAAPAVAAQTRRAVVTVNVSELASAEAVKRAAEQSGASLPVFNEQQAVAVFETLGGENPVVVAARWAERLWARDAARRFIIDVETLRIQPKSDGTVRYTGAALSKSERYGQPTDPPGVFFTTRAAATAPELECAPAHRPELAVRVQQLAASPTAFALTIASTDHFTGRAAELAQLEALLAEPTERLKPVVVSVLGDAGLGKSALAAEVVAHRGSNRWLMRGLPSAPGEADALYRALTEAVLERKVDDPATCQSLTRAALGDERGAERWPALALGLGLISSDAPELANLAKAPGALRLAMGHALGDLIRAKARKAPLCVLVDDAHLASEVVLDALEYAADAEAGAPVGVVAFARPSFKTARAGWGERATERHELILGPIGESDADDLVRRLLLPAELVPGPVVKRLVARGGGSPRVLVELVAGLKSDGVIRQHPNSQSWYIDTEKLEQLPDVPALEWAVTRSVSALGADLVVYAQLLAKLGEGVKLDEVRGTLLALERAGLGATFRLDAKAALDELVEKRVLGLRSGRYSFVIDTLRNTLLKNLPAALAQHIHVAAADWYASNVEAHPEFRSRFAQHLVAAGRPRQALPLLLGLAQEAAGRHEFLTADGLLTQVIEVAGGEATVPLMTALRGRGLSRQRLSRFSDAFTDFSAAAATARALGEVKREAEVLLDQATALDWVNRFAESTERIGQVERLLGQVSAPELEPRLNLARGRAAFRKHDFATAITWLRKATIKTADHETRAASLACLLAMLPWVDSLVEAEAVRAELIEISTTCGDSAHLTYAYNNSRSLWIVSGRADRAIEDLKAALTVCRESGLATSEIYAAYNVAELLYLSGEAEQALVYARRAHRFEVLHRESMPRPAVALLVARILVWQRSDEAPALIQHIDEVIEAARREKNPNGELVENERIMLAALRLCLSLAPDSEWDALCNAAVTNAYEQDPIEVFEFRARAAFWRGDLEAAGRHLRTARELTSKMPNVMQKRLAHLCEAMGLVAGQTL